MVLEADLDGDGQVGQSADFAKPNTMWSKMAFLKVQCISAKRTTFMHIYYMYVSNIQDFNGFQPYTST
jgi:hypothetical protein